MPGDLEHDVGALVDLVQGDLLALRLVLEVLRVLVDHLDVRIRVVGALLEAGDPVVHRWDGYAADGRDGAALRHHRRDDARKVTGLLRRELKPDDVRKSTRRLILSSAVRLLAVELIDAGEVGVGRLGCHLDHGRLDEEADRNDEVVPVVDRSGQVRQVVIARVGDVHAAGDSELALGLLEAGEGELVEAAVVDSARVGDHADADVLSPRRRGRIGRTCRCRRRLVVVAAAAGRDHERERDEHQKPRKLSPCVHGTSLVAHAVEWNRRMLPLRRSHF